MSAPKQAAAAKHWCFTLNDAEDNLEYTDVIEIWGPHCDYMVFQEEQGEEGTKHYQGYAEFKEAKRLTAIVAIAKHFKPHWEKRKGKPADARNYCMKEDTRVAGPWEVGEWKGAKQGKRSDLEPVAEMIKQRKTQKEIFEEYPVPTLRCFNAIQNARQMYRPKRDPNVPFTVTLIVGLPGTGKTQTFWEKAGEEGWEVPVSGRDLWFTGYNGEKNVLIDDFYGNIGLTQFLKILDKYPISCPSKGSHVWWMPDNICVTSNGHPWQWYDYENRQDSYAALKRRFHHVIRCFKTDEGEYDMEQLDVEDYFENQKVDRVVKKKAQDEWAALLNK